ncbi:MAG: hypothetical protein HYV37_00525 [Candidatus Levyibacteriota bacterium]|nr:MAG: hypothetical protein HYV37_00525 [Candidatus Levybacteria bacterium]
MDDTVQNSVQSSKFKVQSQTQGDDSATTQVQSQVVPQPVGSVAKEHGPIEEYIKSSGAELELIIPEELKNHVEVVSDREKPQLTHHHKAVGIHPAKESVSVAVQPQQVIQLPMTEEEALQAIKTTSISDSKHWMAVLIEKVYEHIRNMHRRITN